METMPRLPLLLLSLLALAAGCTASRPMPVMIEVADSKTGQPLENVIVRASGGTFYIPTMQPSMLGAPGAAFGPAPSPEGAAGETDQDGRAYMTVSGQRPVFLHFFKAGYPEGRLILETGETQVLGAVAWTTGTTVPGIATAVLPDGEADTDHPRGRSRMMYRASANAAASP